MNTKEEGPCEKETSRRSKQTPETILQCNTHSDEINFNVGQGERKCRKKRVM